MLNHFEPTLISNSAVKSMSMLTLSTRDLKKPKKTNDVNDTAIHHGDGEIKNLGSFYGELEILTVMECEQLQ